IAELPQDLAVDQPHEGEAYFDLSEGLRLGLVEGRTEVDYDLDHAAMFSHAPTATARAYERLGFRYAPPGASEQPRVEVGGAFVELHDGDPGDPERPLLNHLAVLVDSTDEHIAEGEELGVEIAGVVDAPKTHAGFPRGPHRVRIEYVEHKASFSLT